MAQLTRLRVRRGAILVEAALVLLIIILLTFGVCEYGWCLLKKQQIALACRDGARAGSLEGATWNDVVRQVERRMSDARITTYTLTPVTLPTKRGEVFTITITVPYGNTDLSIVRMPLIPVPENLISSFTMAKEAAS